MLSSAQNDTIQYSKLIHFTFETLGKGYTCSPRSTYPITRSNLTPFWKINNYKNQEDINIKPLDKTHIIHFFLF